MKRIVCFMSVLLSLGMFSACSDDDEITDDPDPYTFSDRPQVLQLKDLIELHGTGVIKTYKLIIVKRDEGNS